MVDMSKTSPFDPAEYLRDEGECTEYLNLALESGDPAHVATALNTVARARNKSQMAQEAGVSRQTLYTALSKDGNPTLATFLAIVKSLGLCLRADPIGTKTRVI